MTLSEGGVGIKTNLALEEGDEARIRLLPAAGQPIDVRALVWNEDKRFHAHGRTSLRVFGCVVSAPPAPFLRLLGEMSGPKPESRRAYGRRRTAPPAEPPAKREPAAPVEPEPFEIVEDEAADPSLPSPKTPLPPPKPDPGDGAPVFRLRVKQVNGPRTRSLKVPARSLMEAQIWMGKNLEGDWEILQVAGIDKAGRG